MKTQNAIVHNLSLGNNSFGLLRLLAASAVVYSHVWTIAGGYSVPEPLQLETGFSLGWHAVNLFFALSGLLIAGSLHHSKSIFQFALARFLRIFPALIALIFFTVVVAALAVDASDWGLSTVGVFIIRNVFLIGAGATLPGVFENNPLQSEINIPLWTLKYEMMAYISLVTLSSVCMRFSNRLNIKTIVLMLLAVCALVLGFFGPLEEHGRVEHAVRLVFTFYLGVAAWHWREKIYASGVLLLLLSVANIGLIWLEVYYSAAQIVWLAYAGLWFGTRSYGWVSRFTDKQDYSYGIYIIGYPVQQAVRAYWGNVDPWFNLVVAMTLIVGLAACSWNLVENPAIKLKKRFIH